MAAKPEQRRRQRRLTSGTDAEANHAALLPDDVLICILAHLDQRDRVAASGTCRGWRAVADQHDLWPHVHFATRRDGSRRSELRRLLSLAAWARRHAARTTHMALSTRLPPEYQPAALSAASQAALAAAGSLQALSLAANRGFRPGAWLPCLPHLRDLHLRSCEGALSLNGDLTPLVHLTSLVLEARQGVELQAHIRLPPGVVRCELGCIRDTLPAQLSQLSRLGSLAVRRALVSEGVLLTEHEVLAHLKGLTSLLLERQEDEAWLPPSELLLLSRLRSLSISGNDCSRWPLHGSDEAFDLMLGRMTQLTSLDLSGCALEELPAALLAPSDLHGSGSGAGAAAGEGQSDAGMQPRLRRLLAHGNQLEAGGEEEAPLVFPSTVRQLSIDWQVLQALRPRRPGDALPRRPPLVLPAACRQLALLGRDGVDAALLADLPALLPSLRQLLLEPHAFDTLWRQPAGHANGSIASCGDWQLVCGRWRPTRLPGQPRGQAQQDVQGALRAASVEVLPLHRPAQLASLFEQLEQQQL